MPVARLETAYETSNVAPAWLRPNRRATIATVAQARPIKASAAKPSRNIMSSIAQSIGSPPPYFRAEVQASMTLTDIWQVAAPLCIQLVSLTLNFWL